MSKPWKKKPKPQPLPGPCDVEGCRQRGGELFECQTCLDLAAAGKLTGEVFKRKPCVDHRDKALEQVRRHAVTAHPVNLLRVAAAALRGE